jgi:hypothetical protein
VLVIKILILKFNQLGMLVKNILNTNKELQRGTKENAAPKIRDTKEMAKEKLQKEVSIERR